MFTVNPFNFKDLESRSVSFCFILYPSVSIRLLFFTGKAERLARGLRPKNGETHWGRHNREKERGDTTGRHNGKMMQNEKCHFYILKCQNCTYLLNITDDN